MPGTHDYLVRPMTAADLTAVERVTDAASFGAELGSRRGDEPAPARRSPEASARWVRRTAHLLEHDPRGCWVAEDDRGVLGAAVSMKRDLTWLLASYAVRPGLQGRGVGRQLLDAAQASGSGCLRAMLTSSQDPGALRRFRLAGFTLHPTLRLHGRVPRACLPVVERVREGTVGDRDLMDSVDRRVRDAAHGVDHRLLGELYRLVVVDRTTGSGYAYVGADGSPHLLAATNRRTATDLLWESLAASDPDTPVVVENATPANEWALDVGLAARLRPWTAGCLALRGMKPPAPYLPSGALS